jgi:hypothetical protein
MVCLRNIRVDTLHKGGTENNDDDDDDDNNNNNNNKSINVFTNILHNKLHLPCPRTYTGNHSKVSTKHIFPYICHTEDVSFSSSQHSLLIGYLKFKALQATAQTQNRK